MIAKLFTFFMACGLITFVVWPVEKEEPLTTINADDYTTRTAFTEALKKGFEKDDMIVVKQKGEEPWFALAPKFVTKSVRNRLEKQLKKKD